MICAACLTSDAAARTTLSMVNLILSGELPGETFLLDGNLLRFEKPESSVMPIESSAH